MRLARFLARRWRALLAIGAAFFAFAWLVGLLNEAVR